MASFLIFAPWFGQASIERAIAFLVLVVGLLLRELLELCKERSNHV